MTPTTSTAERLEQLDPWGFGVTGSDQSATVEWLEPLDEPVDPDDPAFTSPLAIVTLPGSPSHLPQFGPVPAPTPIPAAAAAAAVSSPAVARDRALLRLPFPTDRIGVVALFGAVIVAQAFYIGFSLTGEASARPEGPDAVVTASPTAIVTAPAAAGTAAPASVSRPGVLKIDTGAAVAEVRIDGTRVGATPFVMADLAAGQHAVRVVFRSGAAVERTVTVAASETVSLVLEAPVARATAPAGPVSGWVSINAPFDVQVFENGHLVGTNASARIMMPAGGHVLELVNATLGYRAEMKAAVAPGKVATLAVDAPRMPVAINAQPWAEVVVDGRVHGDTPMANLMLSVGVHRIVLRHPELGERTQVVTVRAGSVNRVSADLRR